MLADFQVEVVGAIASTLLLLSLAALINQGRRRRDANSQCIMRLPAVILVLGMGYSLLVIAAVVLFAVVVKPFSWSSLLGLVVGLPGYALVGDSLRTRCEVQSSGLVIRTLCRPRTSVEWNEITFVSWAPVNQWFVVRTETHGKFRVSSMMSGLPTFARALQQRVPGERIAPAARELLQNASHGSLPEIRLG
jgi:hypothetical protein